MAANTHGIPTVYLPQTEADFQKFVDFADSVGPEWRSVHVSSDGKTQVWDRKSDVSSVNVVRLVAHIATEALVLYDTLHDPDYRKVWDENMIEGYLIEQLDDFNDVGYYSAKAPVALVASRDFCNERSWQVKDNRQYVIMNHSVVHPKCPEKKGFVRANSITSGYLVRVDDAGGCTLTYITQADPRGWIPTSVMNFVTSKYAPKIITKLENAANGYNAWKAAHAPGHFPWRQIINLPQQ